MNKWTTQVSNDTCLYSLFCTPCAFGDNMKKVQQGTSCYKHCLLYSLSYIIGTISGIVWATALPVPASYSRCYKFVRGVMLDYMQQRIEEN